jgi:DGQHR domain-containing protein
MTETKAVEAPAILNAVEAHQHGRRLLIGKITAKDLARLFERGVVAVDIFSSSNPDGYQRSLQRTRSRRFGRFVGDQAKGIAPTGILLYVREPQRFPDASKSGVYQIPAEEDDYGPLLWLSDGQHRTDGISEAFKEGWLAPDAEYEIPVSILFWDGEKSPSDPRLEEASQFYTINQEQKRMRTDLAHQYIFRQYQQSGGPIGDSTVIQKMRKRDYVPFEIYISRSLRDDPSSQWRGLISVPNTPGGAVSEGSFTDSLLPIMDYAATAGLTIGETIQLLKTFWSAVFINCPQARSDFANYVLLKTSGVYALHIFLPTLLIRKPNLGKQPSIHQLQTVLGTIGDKFTDEYWDSETGEAAQFGTSHKAFQEIANDIISELPE